PSKPEVAGPSHSSLRVTSIFLAIVFGDAGRNRDCRLRPASPPSRETLLFHRAARAYLQRLPVSLEFLHYVADGKTIGPLPRWELHQSLHVLADERGRWH